MKARLGIALWVVSLLFVGFWGCDTRQRVEPSEDNGRSDASVAADRVDPPSDRGRPGVEPSTTPDASDPAEPRGTPDGSQGPEPNVGPEPQVGPEPRTGPEPNAPDASQGPEPNVGPEPQVGPEPSQPDHPPAKYELYLYDDDSNQFLIPMRGVVDLKPYVTRKSLNLALKTSDPQVSSVRFQFDNRAARTESAAAYTVFPAGDHLAELTKGSHTVRATIYDGAKATGKVLGQPVWQFTIKDTVTRPGGQHLPADPTQVPADPSFSNRKNVNKTIVITKPGVYDYKNVLHYWTGSGSCNQTENQPHILRIQASNVTVKNFAYRNAPDGIHIATCGKGQGNTCTGSISNITLDNVTGWACEDALTTGKGTKNITIKNSFFMGNPNKNYRDKCIQVNFGDNFRVEYTIFKNCKRPLRFKSGSKITVIGSRFYIFQQAIRGDTYKDISGIVPNRAATVTSDGNHFQEGSVAFSALGKVTVTSTNDAFRNVRNRSETKDGGKVSIK